MSLVTLDGPDQHAIEQRICHGTSWLGVPARKNPMDAWVYQEIIHELRPDVIVEVGNHAGGSLLYLASICEMVGHGVVLGVDKTREFFDSTVAQHHRVQLVGGDAIDSFPAVAAFVGERSALVIEDSAHTYQHTLAVLRAYGALVQPGGYMICEDGVMPEVARALATFTTGHRSRRWMVDRSREWPLTWNPGGYLRRVK